MSSFALIILAFSLFANKSFAKDDPRYCEVCINVLSKFEKWAADEGKSDVHDVKHFESLLPKFCELLAGKEKSFCYYIGATNISATSVMNVVSKPMSYYKPIEKICREDVNKLDPHICGLRYDQDIDWSSVDLKKMRVVELKKILAKWNEECHACTEKSEFIRKIEEVKHKHIPASSGDKTSKPEL